jgi:hypothetical protein
LNTYGRDSRYRFPRWRRPCRRLLRPFFGWSNSAQQFKFWFRGFPDGFHSLTTGIETSKAYFFQASGEAEIHGLASPNVAIPNFGSTLNLVTGANQAVWGGGNHDTPAKIQIALNELNPATALPAITAVFWWSEYTQGFKFWFRGFPDNFQTLSSVLTGGSYYLQSSANVAMFMD